jgi:hypothetical protein
MVHGRAKAKGRLKGGERLERKRVYEDERVGE